MRLPGEANGSLPRRGETSKKARQGKGMAHRLVSKPGECKFHLQKDKPEGGAASDDPNRQLWKILAAS